MGSSTIIKYDDIVDIDKIKEVYKDIIKTTKHKKKITTYNLFISDNLCKVYNDLKNKTYTHKKYNIFIIHEPKERIIMSEGLYDKIVNHLVSKYILNPLLDPKFIYSNVATRKNKGNLLAYKLTIKYINSLKLKGNIYILKFDIKKYFYNIDHNILKYMLEKDIKDNDILNILFSIIDSTNNTNIYKLNKGLPIGNMTSQILAIYYLNGLDHYIKEVLKEKYYIRYMDDGLILSNDKDKLKKDLILINKYLNKLDLELNNRTYITSLDRGITFLGYRYILNNKRLIIKLSKKNYYRIRKRIKDCKSTSINYNGVLKWINIKTNFGY